MNRVRNELRRLGGNRPPSALDSGMPNKEASPLDAAIDSSTSIR